MRPLENGYFLREVTAETIVEVIQQILHEPARLPLFARQSRSAEFMPGRLAAALMQAGDALTHV